MTSRERIRKAINHEESDRIPIDLGSTLVTGIAASTYARLREALGLARSPVKITDPFQMLAEVELEVIDKLGIDTIGLQLPRQGKGFKERYCIRREYYIFHGGLRNEDHRSRYLRAKRKI